VALDPSHFQEKYDAAIWTNSLGVAVKTLDPDGDVRSVAEVGGIA
jgi:hypothetical protein